MEMKMIMEAIGTVVNPDGTTFDIVLKAERPLDEDDEALWVTDWVMVPAEATPKMLEAIRWGEYIKLEYGEPTVSEESAADAWRDFVAAAPKPKSL